MKILFTDNIFVRGFWFVFSGQQSSASCQHGCTTGRTCMTLKNKNLCDVLSNEQTDKLVHCVCWFSFSSWDKNKNNVINQVRVALHFIEDNLPAGEEGIYAVVNNAGVRTKILSMILCLFFFISGLCLWRVWLADMGSGWETGQGLKKKKVSIIERNFPKIRLIWYAHFLWYSIFCLIFLR